MHLARVASEAALGQPGVTGLDGGLAARHTTFSGTQRLPGVTVFADGDRLDVALYVTAEPTDLRALAARIHRAVERGADAARLPLGEVHVTVTDLTLPDEDHS